MERVYRIRYSEGAKRELKKLDPRISRVIIEAIQNKLPKKALKHSKPLKASMKGFRRLRVGQFRVIFCMENKKLVILIVKVRHRKNVYL